MHRQRKCIIVRPELYTWQRSRNASLFFIACKLLWEERREQAAGKKSAGKQYSTDDMDLSIFEE